MKLVAGRRFLELHELEVVGVAYSTVMAARKRGSQGWSFMKDPADRRKLLISYDDLKPSIKVLVDAKHGEAVADSRRVEWVSLLAADAADLAVLRGHRLPDGSGLPQGTIEKCARACALLRMLNTTSVRSMRAWGYTGAAEFYADVLDLVRKEELPVPSKNHRALLAKARELCNADALCVVSKRFGNANARKIGEAQSAWLVSMYAMPTKPDTAKVAVRYNAEALERGWPALTEAAIRLHLMRPEIKPLWWVGRHGTAAWKQQYEHIMKLAAPTMRDALWCSDGTKLNYFYQGAAGMVAKMQVYVVMDVYSEAIIGHSLSAAENFKAQYEAAKAALKLSGYKPLQWLYDGQGGHKKAEQQDFFDRATKLHFPAQPYNPKSKPVESLIGRMQREVMKERWFYTGANITSKRLDSRPNMEFIEAHRDQLPTLEEVMRYVQEDIARWNSMAHPKSGTSRMAMYLGSVNPQAKAVGFLDMVDLFWHTTQRPVTYTNKGIRLEVGNHRFEFEVYKDGAPSIEFLRRWTNASFRIKFDVEDLSQVLLYREDESGELRYVATAETKRAYHRAAVDLVPGERAEIDANLALRKEQQARIKAELEELRNISGVDPETLVELGPRAPKDALNDAEATLLTKRTSTDDDDGYEAIDIYVQL